MIKLAPDAYDACMQRKNSCWYMRDADLIGHSLRRLISQDQNQTYALKVSNDLRPAGYPNHTIEL
jgi:hypothetical protein